VAHSDKVFHMPAETSSQRVRWQVIYSGRVQGVCFRATALELARSRPVVGFVRNRPDGTVELEAEGSADEVERFLATVAQEFYGYIRAAQRTALPARSEEQRFDIHY
jgi:acylphosphatase